MSSDQYRTVYIEIYYQQIKFGNFDLYSLNQNGPNVLLDGYFFWCFTEKANLD